MTKRRQSSGGQAIVMVTVALISMSGMMGLAVDLGWSFFTQKAAQAAADDAALAAVQRGYKSIVTGGGLVTLFTACGTSNVTCAASPVACDPGNTSLGNLQSGCLYAKNDGFVPGGHTGRQNVMIEANIPSVALPDSIPTPPGPPKDMVYWVTVRTYESIPQLFSFVNGKQNGAIAAVATAAVASKVVPGSFWGMNQIGDCRIASGSAKGGFTFTGCGVDIDVSTHTATCGSSGQSAFLCAPSGVLLSSTCAHNNLAGCGNSTTTPGTTVGNNYAGNNGAVYGGPAIEMASAHSADGLTTTTPESVTGVPVDPYGNKPQPPLAASATSSSPIGSCGYPAGAMPSGGTLGPLQFYSYTTNSTGMKIPDGKPLAASGVTFDPTKTGAAGCPGGTYTAGANTQSANSSFPTYVFYGGLSTDKSTITLGAGQYVLAGNLPGQNTCNGCSGGSDNVLAAKQTTFTGAGTSNSTTDPGVMLVLTDGKYPGLTTQVTDIPNYNCTALTCGGVGSMIDPNQTNPATGENYLVQGSIQTKLVNWTLDGYNKNNTSDTLDNLEPYSGVLLWQDRRNSTDIYNADGSVAKCYNASCASAPTAADYEANNVTADSPGLSMSDGNGTLVMKGAIVQPRGAWYNIFSGTAGVGNSPLQVLTGQLTCTNGCGNDSVTLLGPTNPIITYLPVLIQ